MVRLKLRTAPGLQLDLKSFNSTMVRLKRNDDEIEIVNVTQFQFHYGAIKTVLLIYICVYKR